MDEYLIAVGVIFAVNLLPAFGPPTWSILIFFTLSFDLTPAIIVPVGAVAAAGGRLVLASASRRLRGRMSAERLENLAAAESMLTANRSRSLTGLGLFAVSPLPSAQLFVAAGLLEVALLPLTAAFFAGRLVAYSLYVGAASAAGDNLAEIAGDSLTSPLGLALQILMLVALVALVRVDWRRVVSTGSAPASETETIHPS